MKLVVLVRPEEPAAWPWRATAQTGRRSGALALSLVLHTALCVLLWFTRVLLPPVPDQELAPVQIGQSKQLLYFRLEQLPAVGRKDPQPLRQRQQGRRAMAAETPQPHADQLIWTARPTPAAPPRPQADVIVIERAAVRPEPKRFEPPPAARPTPPPTLPEPVLPPPINGLPGAKPLNLAPHTALASLPPPVRPRFVPTAKPKLTVAEQTAPEPPEPLATPPAGGGGASLSAIALPSSRLPAAPPPAAGKGEITALVANQRVDPTVLTNNASRAAAASPETGAPRGGVPLPVAALPGVTVAGRGLPPPGVGIVTPGTPARKASAGPPLTDQEVRRASATATLSAPLYASSRVIPAAVDRYFGKRTVYTCLLESAELDGLLQSAVVWFAPEETSVAGPSPLIRAPNLARTGRPAAARTERARVYLRALITAAGDVEGVSGLTGNEDPTLQAAIEFVSQWRFVPAKRAGTSIGVTVVFALEWRGS